MILDNNLILSGSVSAAGVVAGQLATAVANNVSTNVIDTGPLAIGSNQPAEFGQGEALEVVITILQTLTSGGAATVQFQLVEADDAAISSNVNVLVQSDVFGYASLTAGTVVPLHYDRAAPYIARRYVALRIVIGTATLTNGTGQFFAAVVKSLQDLKTLNLKSGFAVS